MKDFTIMPLKGYGEIPFGMTLDDAVKKLGMPDFYEELSDMEETGNRSIYYEYDELETNIYFEGVTKSVVACFETENMEATLYGEPVFDLTKEEIIDLMKKQGFKELEEEKKPENESRLENLKEFIGVAKDFEKEEENPNLENFLSQLALVSDIDNAEMEEDRVTLMTLHSSIPSTCLRMTICTPMPTVTCRWVTALTLSCLSVREILPGKSGNMNSKQWG